MSKQIMKVVLKYKKYKLKYKEQIIPVGARGTAQYKSKDKFYQIIFTSYRRKLYISKENFRYWFYIKRN
jgi:hypothetical protein